MAFPIIGALVLALAAHQAHACVYLMGTSLDSVAAKPAGSPWNYGFRGDDWQGVDATNKSWTCQTGKKQSPINVHSIPKLQHGMPSLRTQWSYKPVKSNGTNIQVFNNGHTIQVQFAPDTIESSVLIQTAGKKVTDVLSMTCMSNTKTVRAIPLQFHFHSDSEHTVDGQFYPLELHIVHVIPQSELPECPATGCLTVTGILLKLDPEDKENPYLKAIWDVMPMREGLMVDLPKGDMLDIQGLLPSELSYAQYEGSLTTPPCTEGLLWHLFTAPQTLSLDQLRKYSTAVGNKDCEARSKSGRGLKSAGHDHSHDHTAPSVGGFVRGSYAGFTRVTAEKVNPTARKLQAAATVSNPDNYICKVVSYGFTNRFPQPLNDRSVLIY